MTDASACWKLLDLTPNATDAQVEAAYRRKIRWAHPDAGGSHELATKLNWARDEALKLLRQPRNEAPRKPAPAEHAESPAPAATPDDFIEVDITEPEPDTSRRNRLRARLRDNARMAGRKAQRTAARALPFTWQRLRSRWGLFATFGVAMVLAMNSWHWSIALAPRASAALHGWGVPDLVISGLAVIGAIAVTVGATVVCANCKPTFVGDFPDRPEWFFAGCIIIWLWTGAWLVVPFVLFAVGWLVYKAWEAFGAVSLTPIFLLSIVWDWLR